MVIKFNSEFNSYSIGYSELVVSPVYAGSVSVQNIIGYSVIDFSLNEVFNGSLQECFTWCSQNFSGYISAA